MSANNGLIRIGRKGIKEFAFGEDGPVFKVDVVVAFQQWISIDDSFRPVEENAQGSRPIAIADMPGFHQAAVEFVEGLGGSAYSGKLSTAEAMDFIARLREQYDELATFFRPKSREERVSPATSAAQSELRFSVEEDQAPSSPNSTS